MHLGRAMRACRIAVVGLVVVAAAGWLGETAEAQGALSSLSVTEVDASAFPELHVQVMARDADGVPLELSGPAGLRLTEDGAPMAVASVRGVDVGVRVAFVIEPGDGVANTGESLAAVYGRALTAMETFLVGRPWMVSGVDEALVLVQAGTKSVIVAPLGNDAEALASQVQAYTPPSDAAFPQAPAYGDFTRLALRKALDELEFTPNPTGRHQVIVLFTPGARAEFSDIAERAIGLGIPIHVILARETRTAYWDEALRPVAQVTGGDFVATYETEDLESVFKALTLNRRQTMITVRSASASTGNRQLTVEYQAGDTALSASGQYLVAVQPPTVAIASPSSGAAITRKGLKAPSTPADADPTFATVAAQVTWPDGLPRALRLVRLMVDNAPVAESQASGNRMEISWDIRSYTTKAKTPAVLRVEIEDELGLRASSKPITVSVEYVPAPGINLSSPAIVYASGAVALVALGLALFVFFNRGRLGPALQQAGEEIVDFVERVTGRRTSLIARAYLVPLEGFDQPPGQAFEIYGTTAIGRSRRHADLLFHVTDDNSPISRLHCTILDEDDHFAIRDEDSTNGTLVNGEKLRPMEPLVLHDGDLVDVAPLERGGLRFLFQLAAPDGGQPDLDREFRTTRPRRGPRSEAGN
jgi:hypothetical protein